MDESKLIKFWEKVSRIMGLIPLGALLSLVILVTNLEIKDLDLWLHLAAGKFITLNKIVPSVDFLSFSINGKPWINHEWLFQVIVYKIHNLWGMLGLLRMQTVIVTLTMIFLFLTGYSKDKELPVTFTLILVYLVYHQRFTIRPDLYSLLFFAFFIYLLAIHLDKKWTMPVLFFAQIIWTNMHGFFFFGPIFILIGIISEWMKRNITLPFEWNDSGRLTDEEYSRLKFIFILVFAACFINPYFIKGALYPVDVFLSLSGASKIFFEYIQELQQPVSFSTLLSSDKFIYYKLLIFFSLISFIFNRRKIDISALFLWLLFLFFSIKALRNTVFFSFAAYLVIITNVYNISLKDIVPLKFTSDKFKHLTSIFVKLLLLIWIIFYSKSITSQGYYDFDKYEHKSEFGGVSLKSYPTKAVDFLIENKIKGNFFNDFNSGAYLLGRTYPDIKVFIDGRTEVYGPEFFKQYLKIWENGNKELFEHFENRHNITGVLLSSVRQYISKETLELFYNDRDWKLVYFDFDALIFLKNVPLNKEIIEKYFIDLKKWKPKKIDLYKFGPNTAYPYRNYYRSYVLECLDIDEPAMVEAKTAIEISPDYPEPYQILGKIYAKQKNYQKAFENFRIVVSFLPNSKENRFNLAKSYFDLGKYEQAVKEFKILSEKWPMDAGALFSLSRAYIKNKQYDLALNALDKAHKIDPNDVMDMIAIGDIFYEENRYEDSRKVFEKALETNKKLDIIHNKLGIVLKTMGDKESAIVQFNEALSFNPDNVETIKHLKEIDIK